MVNRRWHCLFGCCWLVSVGAGCTRGMEGFETLGGTGGDAGTDVPDSETTHGGEETTGGDAESTGSSGGPDETSGSDGYDTDDPFDDTGGIPEPDLCAASDLEELARGLAPNCADEAPPDSFDPQLEWSFPPRGEAPLRSDVIALVANLTDDDDNGQIDLCDTPDIVLLTSEDTNPSTCQIHVLDGNYGETGIVHAVIDHEDLWCLGTPAIADIDDDGQPEIVVVTGHDDQRIMAMETDGTVMWLSEPTPEPPDFLESVLNAWKSGAVAIDDVDGDGTAEIAYGNTLYDAQGQILWSTGYPDSGLFLQAPILADLDDDGRRELINGYSAYTFDEDWQATPLWNLDDDLPPQDHVSQAIAQVANFDDEPAPEVFVTSQAGYFLLEHDGTVRWGPHVPTETELCPMSSNGRKRPAVVEDFNGDGQVDVGFSACSRFHLFEVTNTGLVEMFGADVVDSSGSSGSTAFDFLGDGTPEPIYSDEAMAYAWSFGGEDWEPRLELPRSSGTWMEFPVVADVDDDGSAEILVVSGGGEAPALQVFGDADDRWIQARRIWNQHTYTVTNIREDGRLPETRLNHWEHLNTFRVNSQIENGAPCVPAG